MKKRNLLIAFVLLLTLVVTACGNTNEGTTASNSTAETDTETIKVGVMAGPESEAWEVAKEVAAKNGLNIELVTFSDYVLPNKALEEGEIDANAFQHVPYLDEFNANNGTHVVKLADTINFPIRIYSSKINDISEIKEGDVLGLPNDPSNGARALILFQEAGLIKLKEDVGITATVKDIVENPLNLEFKELDAAFIPKTLDELTAAVINTTFALDAGLTVSEDAIFSEPADSPWVNIIAVREGETDKAVFKKLVEAYQSDEVKSYVTEKYGDSMVPAW